MRRIASFASGKPESVTLQVIHENPAGYFVTRSTETGRFATALR